MKANLWLDEDDLKKAIASYLQAKCFDGYKITGVMFSGTEEDRTRNKIVSASVTVEKRTAAPPTFSGQ